MVYYWSLNDSKAPQVSGSFLSILAKLNNALDWMIPTFPLTS